MTLDKIEKALTLLDALKWHYDESADWDGVVTALVYIGDDVLTTGDGLTVSDLQTIGSAPDAIRLLLPIAKAAREYVNAIPAFDHDVTGKREALVQAVRGLEE